MDTEPRATQAYLDGLDPERRAAIAAVRETILTHLPPGYEEVTGSNMIVYQVPLDTYPDTYNGKPLMYAALASQKSHMAVYLIGVHLDQGRHDAFRTAYLATGKRLDMGRSCVRFRRLDDLPLELVGEAIGALDVDAFVGLTERSRAR